MNTFPSPDASFDASPDAPAPSARPRTSTIVWGLLLTATGVLILAWLLTDIAFDPLVVLLGLTLGTGAALLVGGAVSAYGGRNSGRNSGAQ